MALSFQLWCISLGRVVLSCDIGRAIKSAGERIVAPLAVEEERARSCLLGSEEERERGSKVAGVRPAWGTEGRKPKPLNEGRRVHRAVSLRFSAVEGWSWSRERAQLFSALRAMKSTRIVCAMRAARTVVERRGSMVASLSVVVQQVVDFVSC